MNQKYVRGIKRNQIIQRWLQGIEDPDYEVFPTKKEGKYIVKLRESPIKTILNERSEVSDKADCSINDPSETNETNEPVSRAKSTSWINEQTEIDSDKVVKQQTLKRSIAPRQQPDLHSKVDELNLEILDQLRSLGEELRNDRFKKEQKQYIKQIVNKELSKSLIRSRYVPETLNLRSDATLIHEEDFAKQEPVETTNGTPEAEQPICQPNITQPICQPNITQPVCQPNIAQQVFRSRIRR